MSHYHIYLGAVNMTPGRLSRRSEFTPVSSLTAKFEIGQTFNTKYLIVYHKIGLVDACFTVQLFESLFTESVYSQSHVCLYKKV